MSKKRARTYARNRTAISRRGNLKYLRFEEPDGIYMLKLALLLVVSSFWVKISAGQGAGGAKNPLNRRFWYLLIIVTGLVSYFLPAGIVI